MSDAFWSSCQVDQASEKYTLSSDTELNSVRSLTLGKVTGESHHIIMTLSVALCLLSMSAQMTSPAPVNRSASRSLLKVTQASSSRRQARRSRLSVSPAIERLQRVTSLPHFTLIMVGGGGVGNQF